MTVFHLEVGDQTHPLGLVRMSRGWTYQQLARLVAAQARQSSVNLAAWRQRAWRWEHRGLVPDLFTQRCLADVLGVPPERVDTHPWPGWLPLPAQPPCVAEIARLRVVLGHLLDENAKLRDVVANEEVGTGDG